MHANVGGEFFYTIVEEPPNWFAIPSDYSVCIDSNNTSSNYAATAGTTQSLPL